MIPYDSELSGRSDNERIASPLDLRMPSHRSDRKDWPSENCMENLPNRSLLKAEVLNFNDWARTGRVSSFN